MAAVLPAWLVSRGRSYTRRAMVRVAPLVGGCALGYTVGSLPFGVWVGRALRGLDVREHGSGGMGTANVLRTVGPAAGATVFALDVAKGMAAVLGARALGADSGGQAAAAVAAVAGHSWPALARFRGGKGVATAFGGLLLVSPEVAAAAVVGGVGALLATRTISVGSLSAAASATLAAAVDWARGGSPVALAYSATVSGIVLLRHRDNIRRLLRGNEPTVTLRPSAGPPPRLAA